jgi:hypothetical protein
MSATLRHGDRATDWRLESTFGQDLNRLQLDIGTGEHPHRLRSIGVQGRCLAPDSKDKEYFASCYAGTGFLIARANSGWCRSPAAVDDSSIGPEEISQNVLISGGVPLPPTTKMRRNSWHGDRPGRKGARRIRMTLVTPAMMAGAFRMRPRRHVPS